MKILLEEKTLKEELGVSPPWSWRTNIIGRSKENRNESLLLSVSIKNEHRELSIDKEFYKLNELVFLIN